MNLRYAGTVLVILLAGCSASHTASPSSVLPGAPSLTSQGVDPFNLSTKNVIHNYPLPHASSKPSFMATGSDKNVWFVESGAPRIGRMTMSGAVTEYTIPSGNVGLDIAPGARGSLWFGECSYQEGCPNPTNIDKITTAGHITAFPMPNSRCARGITEGPDGNMWFTDPCADNGLIGKITPNGTITEYPLPDLGIGGDFPLDIVAGPDGNLWFGEVDGYVGKITPGGSISEYAGPTADIVYAIAAGPDGNLYGATSSGIYKITTSGEITAFTGEGGQDIVLGPDKKMWMSSGSQPLVEFNPTTEVFSPTIIPDPGHNLGGLTLGVDGDVWIADNSGNSILVYADKVTTIGVRLNGEMSIIDPNYGFELGYAVGKTSTLTQTISLKMGGAVEFKNVDTEPHSAALLGDATANSAPWPASFTGSTHKSPVGTAIGTTGWATGSLNPNKTSLVYETGLPGFYMIGCQYHYNTNQMRTVIVVH